MSEVTLCRYDKCYAEDYKRLNLEWIEKYFVVEEHDVEQLSNPEEYIIDRGGEILFAVYEEEVAGVCALIKTGETEFELAKMLLRRISRENRLDIKWEYILLRQQSNWVQNEYGLNRTEY